VAKIILEDSGGFSYHYPQLAVIVTAHAEGRDNAMTVAWHSGISFRPPLYGIAVHPKRFTYELITKGKEFGVNFLPFEKAELLASVGGSRGKEEDKFEKFGIAKEEPLKISAPLLKEAYVSYECQLIDDKAYGDHRWLVGEIVAIHLSQEFFTPEGLLDLAKVNPALWLGAEFYVTTLKETRFVDRAVYGKKKLL
jgi:flavin reductase (DIM6/NTAB) family NADH-FMN oxidoreductase RutF